eukprot:1884459-Pleurochrysis_carterae.AAC.2
MTGTRTQTENDVEQGLSPFKTNNTEKILAEERKLTKEEASFLHDGSKRSVTQLPGLSQEINDQIAKALAEERQLTKEEASNLVRREQYNFKMCALPQSIPTSDRVYPIQVGLCQKYSLLKREPKLQTLCKNFRHLRLDAPTPSAQQLACHAVFICFSAASLDREEGPDVDIDAVKKSDVIYSADSTLTWKDVAFDVVVRDETTHQKKTITILKPTSGFLMPGVDALHISTSRDPSCPLPLLRPQRAQIDADSDHGPVWLWEVDAA